jgi:hypothetical protein
MTGVQRSLSGSMEVCAALTQSGEGQSYGHKAASAALGRGQGHVNCVLMLATGSGSAFDVEIPP